MKTAEEILEKRRSEITEYLEKLRALVEKGDTLLSQISLLENNSVILEFNKTMNEYYHVTDLYNKWVDNLEPWIDINIDTRIAICQCHMDALHLRKKGDVWEKEIAGEIDKRVRRAILSLHTI